MTVNVVTVPWTASFPGCELWLFQGKSPVGLTEFRGKLKPLAVFKRWREENILKAPLYISSVIQRSVIVKIALRNSMDLLDNLFRFSR